DFWPKIVPLFFFGQYFATYSNQSGFNLTIISLPIFFQIKSDELGNYIVFLIPFIYLAPKLSDYLVFYVVCIYRSAIAIRGTHIIKTGILIINEDPMH